MLHNQLARSCGAWASIVLCALLRTSDGSVEGKKSNLMARSAQASGGRWASFTEAAAKTSVEAPAKLLRPMGIRSVGQTAIVYFNVSSIHDHVIALNNSGWLAWPHLNVVVTVTSDPDRALVALQDYAKHHKVIVLVQNPWPGNLAKIIGFNALLDALVKVSPGASAAMAKLLLTDCCDVVFRTDGSCTGSNDIFEKFNSREHSIIFAAEHATNMLMSSSNYTARVTAQMANPRRLDPPSTWLVGAMRQVGTKPWNESWQKHFRRRPFMHTADELPPNPEMVERGIPDACTLTEGVCLHPKSVNCGLVMGVLRSLAELYGGVLLECGPHCVPNGISVTESEQNLVGHYLIKTNFCQGSCHLDYTSSFFHATQAPVSEYRVTSVVADEPQLDRLVPFGRSGKHREGVIVSGEWIALSPIQYSKSWSPIAACALHVLGFPSKQAADLVRLFRQLKQSEKQQLSKGHVAPHKITFRNVDYKGRIENTGKVQH